MSSDSIKRVLIVSANMGEGHNATGRALDEAARGLWPDVEVRWLDTLDVMGPGVGPLFRGIYTTNVERTPWLYEFFYSSVRRMKWFARSSKRFVGAWCGRRLARHIAEFEPNVILSTYPLGSAGLAWLRRHRDLKVPIGAWVSDFSPHPFWVYHEIDLNFVMHEVAVTPAQQWTPGSPIAISAPPVVSRFTPGNREEARRALDLAEDTFVALVSCGSLGFGSVETAVSTLLRTDPSVTVIAVCGRNEALRKRLLVEGDHDGRLKALGWTDDIPALTVASDVVVTNAGGATSLEALACGRAVLMYRPIAAHGGANAELMAQAGLAKICRNEAELATTVRQLLHNPDQLAAIEHVAAQHAAARTTADGLRQLLNVQSENQQPHDHRLRAEDALFVHVETPEVPQQTGAVLILDSKEDGSSATFADAIHLFSAAPGLRGRVRAGSAWRAPRWEADSTIQFEDLVSTLELGQQNTPADLDEAMDVFFSQPLKGKAGEAQLVHGVDGNKSALLIKLNHATADGIAVTGALVGRARGQDFITEPQSDESSPQRIKFAELARGIWALARAGRAQRTELNTRIPSAFRHHARAKLPLTEVRATARALRTTTPDLAIALLAEGLSRVLHIDGAKAAPEHVRVMMPRSTRTTATFRRAGNHTGAASLDLAIGEMPLIERVSAIRAATQAQVDSTAPHAAHAVVWLLGLLPPWLHARLARLVYRSTWFNLIASVLPGARSPVILNGSCVSAVYPVLALAPDVGLSVGIMTWADLLTFCFTGTADTAVTVDKLADAMYAAFKEAERLAQCD